MNVLDSFKLDGKVAIITGGARHLGHDMAEALAEAGCNLAITSRDLGRAKAAAESLSDRFGVDVLPVALDVTDFSAVQAVVERVFSWKGRIDVLINNAGGGGGGASIPTDFFERPVEAIEALIAANLLGTIYCSKTAGKHMADSGSGKIINIASIAGLVGRDRGMYERTGLSGQPVDYAAAKAGIIGFTRDLAAYLAPRGVCVNAISPGGFERGQPREFVEAYSERTALGRMGRDGVDIKSAALFLASPASDYITGENLVVDGGFTIWH
jgi:NAD(P)-dependent dehydrogenase (short-subunit alcohol dehydrogenase family)